MFSNDLKSFIFLNIYLLFIVNIALIISIYYVIIRARSKAKKHSRKAAILKPVILHYIDDGKMLPEVKKVLKGGFSRDIIVDLLLDYSEKNNIDISLKFILLDLDQMLIKKLTSKMDIHYLRKLAFMRSERAYYFLLEAAMSEDFDISYMSFIGLSMINLGKDKKEAVINELTRTDIAVDRKIEILDRFELTFSEWLELLEKEKTIEGKVIFIRNIMQKNEIKIQNNSDRLQKYLNDDKEVRISAILALCYSKNEKYIEQLSSLYDREESWEVRVAIAKGLINYKYDAAKELLQKMTKDNEWWVRYNVIKSIVAMGAEGLFTLIELSLDEDKNISDLAYYFLNSNKDVYNTVKDIEV